MCKSGTIIRLDNMKHVAVRTICVVINIMSGRGLADQYYAVAQRDTPILECR
jgi:hypothetical protein